MKIFKKKKTPVSILGNIAAEFGIGLIAGAVGTAVMTLSQMIEMKITKREPSNEPADAAEKVLDIKPETPADKEKFSQEVHWTYGTVWGLPRSILALTGLKGLPATAIHFATVYSTALIMPASLKVAPPVKDMETKTILINALHHAVYAIAAGLTYDALSKNKN